MVQLFQRKKNQVCVSQKFKAKLKLKFHMYILSEDYLYIFFAIQIPKEYICLECKGTILMEIPWCNNN